jgi:putative membrane protein
MDAMSLLAQALAFVAALIHVFFFYAESVTFARPETWRRFGLQSQEQADIVRPMAYNQGFYNLFLALGIVAGLVLVTNGSVEAGRAVVVFACACMVGAGIVLITTSRAMLRAALLQLTAPLLAIVATFAL